MTEPPGSSAGLCQGMGAPRGECSDYLSCVPTAGAEPGEKPAQAPCVHRNVLFVSESGGAAGPLFPLGFHIKWIPGGRAVSTGKH